MNSLILKNAEFFTVSALSAFESGQIVKNRMRVFFFFIPPSFPSFWTCERFWPNACSLDRVSFSLSVYHLPSVQETERKKARGGKRSIERKIGRERGKEKDLRETRRKEAERERGLNRERQKERERGLNRERERERKKGLNREREREREKQV